MINLGSYEVFWKVTLVAYVATLGPSKHIDVMEGTFNSNATEFQRNSLITLCEVTF